MTEVETNAEVLARLAAAAVETADLVLNGLPPEMRLKIAQSLSAANLYVHVQLTPTFLFVLALDPYDPNRPVIELARHTGESPEFKASLH